MGSVQSGAGRRLGYRPPQAYRRGLTRVRHQTDWTGQNAGPKRILIVDDDAGIWTVLDDAFRRLGYQVQGVPDGLWVARALQQGVFCFNLVVLDWKMPDLDGPAVLQELRACAPEAPLLVISTAAADQLRREVLSLGAFEVLRKPFDTPVAVLLVRSQQSILRRHWEGADCAVRV
jgi:DNA-binding response OmpR family regulator